MKRVIALTLLGVLVAVPTHAQTRNAKEQEVLKASQTSNDASLIKKDRATMERLYADDYTYIHSNGTVANKTQDIAASMSPDQAWTAHKSDDMRVRIYRDVAVVTGISTLTGSAKGYVSGPRRFTEVWVRRNGRWQLVNGQSTLVPAK
jgi:ketosteroid isomerase-like protein